MKKAQRRRLSELLAKDQATLTAAEKSELSILKQLAGATNWLTPEGTVKAEGGTDSEDDEDEGSGESAEGEDDEEDDESESGKKSKKKKSKKKSEGEEEEEEEEEDATPSSSTLAATLAGIVSSFRKKSALGTDLASARAQVGTLTAERDTAISERDSARTEAANLRGTLSAFAEYFGISAADLGAKSSQDILGMVTEKISAGITAQLTELGFDSSKLPAATHSDAQETLEEVQTQLVAETDPKKRAALAIKANKLRDQLWAGKN